MALIAQTNLALYQQLAEHRYPRAEREQVAHAYRLAMRLFSGLYRGSEKPFLSHLVGTASVLATEKAPLNTVIAGLLHAAYMTGDFGFQSGQRTTQRKREFLRQRVGDEVEALISAYTDFPWNSTAIARYREQAGTLQAQERQLLLIRLANELEDQLDQGMLYCSARKADLVSSAPVQANLLEIAGYLKSANLEARLAAAFALFNTGETPVSAAAHMGRSALILPPSSKRKALPMLLGGIYRRIHRAKNWA